jgi:hypothetical protein
MRTEMARAESRRLRVASRGLEDKKLQQYIENTAARGEPHCRETNEFFKRFEARYGPGAVEKFREMIERPDTTLADVGHYFGFSRQYAHKIFFRIYGYHYGELLEKKRKQKSAMASRKRCDSMPIVVREAAQRIRNLGLPVILKKRHHRQIIWANGHTLMVRCCETPLKVGKREHFRITNVTTHGMDIDFLLCCCKGPRTHAFFIIPRTNLIKPNITLIPEAGPNESKYAQFKEAWSLLARKPS